MKKNGRLRALAIAISACLLVGGIPMRASLAIEQRSDTVVESGESPVEYAVSEGSSYEDTEYVNVFDGNEEDNTNIEPGYIPGDDGIIYDDSTGSYLSNTLEYVPEGDSWYYRAMLIGGFEFPDGSSLSEKGIKKDELDTYIAEISGMTGKALSDVYSVSLEVKEYGEVSVPTIRIYVSNIGDFDGRVLYHKDAAGGWYEVPYDRYEEPDTKLTYLEFSPGSMGVFLFATTQDAPVDEGLVQPDKDDVNGEEEGSVSVNEVDAEEDSENVSSTVTPEDEGTVSDNNVEDKELDGNKEEIISENKVADNIDRTKNDSTSDNEVKVHKEDNAGADGVDSIIIDEFNVRIAGGAKYVNGRWVYSPTDPASGHSFVYRVDYTVSGTYHSGPKAIQIEVPLHILKDRNDDWADKFDCPYLSADEVSEGEEPDFVYEIVGDKIVIYNVKSLATGEAGYIEFSYSTTNQTFSYVDMDPSTSVPGKITVVGEDGVESFKEDEADPVYIDTTATLAYTQKKAPTMYTEWSASWGDAPDNVDDYYYLVWPVRSYINKTTQPYNFKLEDTFTDYSGEVVGYRFAGQKTYSMNNIVENITAYGDRYDYVLTRYKKDEADAVLEASDRYYVHNYVKATVIPYDGIDDPTEADSSKSWWYDKPKYVAPTGSFWSNKYMMTYDYQLGEFQDGDISKISNLKYSMYVEGYPYPWTLSDDADGTIEDFLQGRYGTKKVDYALTDDRLYLDGTNEQLLPDDYDIDEVSWTPLMRTVELNTDNFTFTEKAINEYKAEDVIDIWVRSGEDWIKVGKYDMVSSSYMNLDDDYISSASGSIIKFKPGVDGYKFTCSNAYYHTRISATMSITLFRTDHVLSVIGKETGKQKVTVDNYLDFEVTQNDNVLFSRKVGVKDYIQKVVKESEIKKDITKTANNKRKKEYTVTWRVRASEKYVDNEGRHYIEQSSGTFYDLLPQGGVVDIESVAVYASGGRLTKGSYTVSVETNFRDSGHDLLRIDILDSTSTIYEISYNTGHSYDSIKDWGKNLLNTVAFETGNTKIAEGMPDNGGSVSNRDLMAGLNPESDPSKPRFLYAEARYSIDTLMAANTGLMKQVRSELDTQYSYSSYVNQGGSYSYQIRLANDAMTKSKGIIFYDSLENFFQHEDDTTETIQSDWRGTLENVDVSNLKSRGIDVKVYLSKVEHMNMHEYGYLDATKDGEKVWIEYSKFKDTYGLDEAHGIAVDASKLTDGGDYVLPEAESLVFTVYMKAPFEDTTGKTDPIAYNNIFVDRIAMKEYGSDVSEIQQFFHQDYTQLYYRVTGDINLLKVNADDEYEMVAGAVYLLRGTSDYGTVYETSRVSSKKGSISFEGIEKGKYELLETSCSDDWQIDTEVYSVEISSNGDVKCDLDKKGDKFILKDKPRIHADLSFIKLNSITQATITGAKFMLTGTSDYDNDIVITAESGAGGRTYFRNIELGTYDLVETAVSDPDRYILSRTVYKVKVDERGVAVVYENDKEIDKHVDGMYKVYNEPYHSVRFVKSSTYGENVFLQGAEFSLTGVSDYGTSVNMTAVSGPEDDMGLTIFEGLEPGTYLLKETVPPAEHDLNENTYTVVVRADGTFDIEGLNKINLGKTITGDDSGKGE